MRSGIGEALLLFFSFNHYVITSTITGCGSHNTAGLQFKCVLTVNPPGPGEVDHTTGVYVPYSFQTVVKVLLRPTRTGWESAVRQDLQFSSLSEKTRRYNYFQMSLQRQHSLISYLKTLSVGPAGVWTHNQPLCRPALSQLSLPGSAYTKCHTQHKTNYRYDLNISNKEWERQGQLLYHPTNMLYDLNSNSLLNKFSCSFGRI